MRVQCPTADIPAHHIYNYFLVGDTIWELDVTIDDTSLVQAPSLNKISMIISKSKAKEEMFEKLCK